MSIEFLGSKRQLLAFLMAEIGLHACRDDHFVDLFCGTGVVSAAFREKGLRITANDRLALCSTLAEAQLLNHGTPSFQGLVEAGELKRVGGHPYEAALARLDALEPRRGFVFENLSPASLESAGVARMYFSEDNAGRIDAIRRQIAIWEPLLNAGERSLLISDLIMAASRCSNTAGTYGCYLKSWKSRALERLRLLPSSGLSREGNEHTVHQGDAAEVAEQVEADIVYADPPYTKRQYAAYYHVLETIARDDNPTLTGKTGLRAWEADTSEFCYRRRAPRALLGLVENLRTRHFFLSYNSDGQMSDQAIREILGPFGRLRVAEVPYRRYKSSSRQHRGTTVTERLYHLAMA